MMEYKLKEFYKGLIKYMTQALEENLLLRVVLVAQLAEQSFPTPEDPGLHPAISNIYLDHLITVNCV